MSALLVFVGLPALMLVLYTVGIQYERKNKYEVAFKCVAALALVLDVILNWTLFALYLWDWPKYRLHEWTLSTRLVRLNLDLGWRGVISRGLSVVLNYIAPSKIHIPGPTSLSEVREHLAKL
jgi:hypothetical protein